MRKLEMRSCTRTRRSVKKRKQSFRKHKMSGGSIPKIANIPTSWFRKMVYDHLAGIDVREMKYNDNIIFVIEAQVAKKAIDKLYNDFGEEASNHKLNSYNSRTEMFDYFDALNRYVKDHTIKSPINEKEYVIYKEWEKMF